MDLGKKAALVPRSTVGHAQPAPDSPAAPPPPASSAVPALPRQPPPPSAAWEGGYRPAPASQDFTFASPFPPLLCLDYLAALSR